jgi:hypothetical protein
MRDRIALFRTAVRRLALSLAAFSWLAGGGLASELLCVAECDAAAARARSAAPAADGSCHGEAPESHGSKSAAPRDCARHARECAIAAGDESAGTIAPPASTARVFPAAVPSRFEPVVQPRPAAGASARARPDALSAFPNSSSVLRL